MRKSIVITSKEDLDFLLNIDEEESCRLSFIMNCFGKFGNKRRFNPYDILIVPEGYYGSENKKNKNSFKTTVGIWIFNKAFIEKDLFDLFGYINEPITKGKAGSINQKLSYAVLEDKITLDTLKRYVLKTQKFQPYCNILSPSITENMLRVPSKIRKKKEELFKKYEKELNNNDPVTSEKIEGELLKEAKSILKGDPSMDSIDSDAKISFGNNFKNVFVMRGASKESDPTKPKYAIIRSNYLDGVSAEDYVEFANSLTLGPYSRAKKTEVGGAWEKMFVKSLEHVHVLPEGSDCHTKRTITVTLDKNNIKDWMYSYIVDGNKLIEINSDNMNSLIGKTVKLRFSGLCEAKDGICNICAGHLFNLLGLNEVGVASYILPSKIKVRSMKAFHDATIKTLDILEDYGLDKMFNL